MRIAMSIKKLIPRKVKETVKAGLRNAEFFLTVKQLQKLAPGSIPDRALLDRLRSGWWNFGYTADLDYIEEVAQRAATARGPILECGSGLTTIVLGLMAGRRGIPTWTLENNESWFLKIEQVIKRFSLPGITLDLKPLRSYGTYSWYDPPLNMMPDHFSLVICDGPPGSTPGGRYGLLPVLGERLGKESAILLDDADRVCEADTLRKWQEQYGMVSRLCPSKDGSSFAIVTRQLPG